MNTHNLCFEQKYEKYKSFLSENFKFLEVKFSVYLNRRVFVMWMRVDNTGSVRRFDSCYKRRGNATFSRERPPFSKVAYSSWTDLAPMGAGGIEETDKLLPFREDPF